MPRSAVFLTRRHPSVTLADHHVHPANSGAQSHSCPAGGDVVLVAARQKAVSSRGGNGFLTVAATHAALLMARGAGRLLRSTPDQGVLAVLDPRVATARYGGFIRASLPPFRTTHDPEVVRGALKRLAEAQTR